MTGTVEQIVLLDGDEEILKDIVVKKEKMPNSRKLFIILMMLYQICHFCLFFVYINIDSFCMAFQKFDILEGAYVWKGFYQFEQIFNTFKTGNDILNCVKNSMLLFVANNFIILPIAIFCAYIFFKKLPMSSFFRIVFFFPCIISVVVLTMSFSFMFDTYGPFNEILRAMGLGGIIPTNGWLADKNTAFWMVFIYCIWAGIGYDVVFLNGAISRIPTEVFESGQLDGVGMWRELFVMVLPLILPTINTLFINGVTVIFTIFLQPQLLVPNLGEMNHYCGTIAYYIIESVESENLCYASACGILFSLIGIPIVLGVKTLLEKLTPDITF